MKKYFLILSLLCFSAAVSAAQLDTLAVFSAKMQREIPVLVVTPAHCEGERLPVLYLLHGYAGNYLSWQRDITDLRPLSDEYRMMIVCPDGENSWYWDSPLDAASQFETFLSQELPDWIDANYSTIPAREGRAITGLSMGGHGAMWTALRHKDRFGAVGSTSGGVDIRPFPNEWEMKKQLGEQSENRERWESHTVMTAVDSLKDGELAVIVDCGYDDFFFGVNRNLHEKLMKNGVRHDYLVRPGAHTGEYWATSIPYQMLFFHRYFQQQTPQQPIAGRQVCPEN